MSKYNGFENNKRAFWTLLPIIAVLTFLIGCGSTSAVAPNTLPGLADSSALQVTNPVLPTAQVQTAYTAALTASGGKPPYSWSIAENDLPPGLFLNSTVGTVSGTPTAPGTFSIMANLQDSDGLSASAELSLSVSGSATPATSSGSDSANAGTTTASTSSTTSAPPSQTQSPQSGTSTPTTSSSSGSSNAGTTTVSAPSTTSAPPSQTQSPQSGTVAPTTSSSSGSSSAGAATAPTSSTTSAPPSQIQSPQSGTGNIGGSNSAIGVLSLGSQSLSFGNVNVGASQSQTVVVSNSGSANLTISNVSVSGSGVGATVLAIGLVLTPQQTATLDVIFAPAATGGVTGGVVITSDAANSPTSIAVSGTGVQAAVSHSVELTWSASTSTDVTGYDVYRGLTSDGPYTMLTTIVSTNYTDTNVQSGQTYYYVLTAVDSNNVQSDFSTTASATIP